MWLPTRPGSFRHSDSSLKSLSTPTLGEGKSCLQRAKGLFVLRDLFRIRSRECGEVLYPFGRVLQIHRPDMPKRS
jgi:hypothetical protein